jgi:hypothetical protein
MKTISFSHHGIISEEFDVFYYELLRIKEVALRSSSASAIATDEQTDDDAAEYAPAAQTPVTAVRPVVAQYDPALHAAQTDNPAEA